MFKTYLYFFINTNLYKHFPVRSFVVYSFNVYYVKCMHMYKQHIISIYARDAHLKINVCVNFMHLNIFEYLVNQSIKKPAKWPMNWPPAASCSHHMVINHRMINQ